MAIFTAESRPTVILILALFISSLLLQGCEMVYTSSILIPKDIEPLSKDTDALLKDEYINKVFDDYCVYKRYKMKPAQGAESADDTKRKMCYAAHPSLSAQFEDHKTEYKIELSLILPRTSNFVTFGLSERLFCNETADMFDFFKDSLTHERATYTPYASCSQAKVQQ